MKILFVGMLDSIHTARWINSIADSGMEIYLYASNNSTYLHKEIAKNKIRGLCLPKSHLYYINSKFRLVKILIRLTDSLINKIINILNPTHNEKNLVMYIQKIQPDVIHSLGIQMGGYLVLGSKMQMKHKFPTWIVSNWGSDIYYFGKEPSHAKKIKEVMSECDYYVCECSRDVTLAKKFGYRGKVLGVLPNAGGYHIEDYKYLLKSKSSKRKGIMLKGYQGWAGRSMVALQAIDKIGKYLYKSGYYLILYSTVGNKEVEVEAQRICNIHSIKLNIIPQFTDHKKIIELHGQARMSIGLSISDGISTSLLESMLTGSFPIQSFTACANEWVINSRTAILVDPESVEDVSHAILTAASDDKLTDHAQTINFETIRKRAEYNQIKSEIANIYSTLKRS